MDSHILGPTPSSPRSRELWLQHAAGFILFRDIRRYAVGNLDPSLNETARSAALKAIDDALYGAMMVIDGVTGALANSEYVVHLRTEVCLKNAATGEPIESMDLREGDGMCMGYHAWIEGDFGQDPVTV
jgi:hypothetical protein